MIDLPSLADLAAVLRDCRQSAPDTHVTLALRWHQWRSSDYRQWSLILELPPVTLAAIAGKRYLGQTRGPPELSETILMIRRPRYQGEVFTVRPTHGADILCFHLPTVLITGTPTKENLQ